MIDGLAPHAMQALAAMAISMARLLGCVTFIPGFGRTNMTLLHRNAVCMAIGLPQTLLIFTQLRSRTPEISELVLFGLKEGLLGALLGLLLATPYWTFRSALALVDNQRGGNAAQLVNPSLQADSSVLGELTERALTVILVQMGVFAILLDAIAQSYALWPALSAMPHLLAEGVGHSWAVSSAFVAFLGAALTYSAPILLLLLVIEFGFAVSSTAAQGIPVYESAMPVKSLAALFCLAIYFPSLIDTALPAIASWWGAGAFDLFVIKR